VLFPQPPGGLHLAVGQQGKKWRFEMMKTLRKGALVILETMLIIFVLAVTIAYAADIATNGDFSLLTGSQPDYWTPWSGGSIVADATGACGAGIATVQSDGIATAQQCIHLTNPGTSWTFSADMAVLEGNTSAAAYFFYASNDCTGSALSNGRIGNATTSTLQNFSNSFTYDTAANGANSVLIAIETANFSGIATGCFDNVVFSAAGATDVVLHSMNAAHPVPPVTIVALLSVGFMVILLITLIRRRVKS
jgi:hypothetical protein